MKSIAILCSISLLGAVAAAQGPEAPFRPFTATMKVQYWTESGKTTGRTESFARGSDGSYAWSSNGADPIEGDRRLKCCFSFILNAGKRQVINSDPFTRTVVVMPNLDDKELATRLKDYGSCDGLQNGEWRVLGKSKRFGLNVIEVRVEEDKRTQTTNWVVRDLHCFALKHLDRLDGRLRQKEEVVTIELSVPPASAFEPPPGWDSVSPLEREARYKTLYPGRRFYEGFVQRIEDQYQRAVRRTNNQDH